ncbi:MAG TPA: IPTL-CTERM sorting domain-containing protein [Ottowia sp.]|nr:IPTL-CTERM sorting domain-containing protein [Burkholderiales bacterium]HNJ45041.1 IPTL-CTERM sorting domain-containing protein [Ottowia sp.]
MNDVRTQAAVQGPSLWVSAAGPATICLNRGGTTNVTYTYTYRNNGTDPMYGVTASVSMPVTSDSTPVTTTFVSITNPTFGGGTCTAPASPGNPATCSIGTLQPGQQGTFQMTVQIPAGAIGPTLNNGTYSLSGATSAQGGTVVTQLGPLVRTAMSENCAVNVAPVPTLGEWAMMLLASLMAAFGWVMMRRRMG